MRNLVLLCCMALCVIACRKDVIPDDELPQIIVHSPEPNKSCKYGDKITIEVDVKDNIQLKEFKCMLKSDGYEVYIFKDYPITKEYSYKYTYKMEILPVDEFEVKIEVKDYADNKNYVSRTIEVHP